MTVAALYVDPHGAYAGLADVELWDEARDARTYAGPWPVVAHPPCARWCQLAPLVQARYPHIRAGEDGGCFAAALRSVRRWGGVLEHPAYTRAWARHGLPAPRCHGWQSTLCGGWVCQVDQARYGHRARKSTWLYAVVEGLPPLLDWRPGRGSVWMTWLTRDGRGRAMNAPTVERMGRRERNATPPEFRDVLLGIARSALTTRTAA